MCTQCKVAVAKRNFRIRHHHFEEAPLPTVGSDIYERLQEVQTAASAASSQPRTHDRHDEAEPSANVGAPVLSSGPIEIFTPMFGQVVPTVPLAHQCPMVTAATTSTYPPHKEDVLGMVRSFGTNVVGPARSDPPQQKKLMIVPCKARGMPPDHNADVRRGVNLLLCVCLP